MSHRRAPLPPHYVTAPKGKCRWCNLPILNASGEPLATKRWHRACVKAFKLIHWPAETRKAVWIRDGGICQRCKRDLAAEAFATFNRGGTADDLRKSLPSWAPKWQHDHIRPLIEANGDLAFWQLDNVQVLCAPCHITKGKEDNARRREVKRAATQPALL